MHSISELKDGLANLTDQSLIVRAKESPIKLKMHLRKLIKKAENYKVKLNEKNELVIGDTNPLALIFVEKNKEMLKIALKYEEIDFELDHSRDKVELKERIEKSILTEEQARETKIKEREKERADFEERVRLQTLNYENYFKMGSNC